MLALLQGATDFQTIARQAAQFIMPEGILTLFACAALVLDVMLPRNRKRVVAWVSLAGAGFALVSLWILYSGIVTKGAPRTAFYDMIVLDSYAVVFKSMFLVGAALSILLSMKYLDVEGEQRGEYYALILFAVVGILRQVQPQPDPLTCLRVDADAVPVIAVVEAPHDRLPPASGWPPRPHRHGRRSARR